MSFKLDVDGYHMNHLYQIGLRIHTLHARIS
uniref:Uncharacterized protein n=1 Tax=Rhizophora mucronata TaxID=61149 RepID=A0A2P2PCR7_RHIMU